MVLLFVQVQQRVSFTEDLPPPPPPFSCFSVFTKVWFSTSLMRKDIGRSTWDLRTMQKLNKTEMCRGVLVRTFKGEFLQRWKETFVPRNWWKNSSRTSWITVLGSFRTAVHLCKVQAVRALTCSNSTGRQSGVSGMKRELFFGGRIYRKYMKVMEL